MALAGRSLATLLLLAACAPHTPSPPAEAVSGTVELNQGPPSDKLVGGSGSGTVVFHGQELPFAIGGVGVNGGGIAVLQTSGEAYHLDDIASFPGTYRRAPADVVPAALVGNGLWLRNEHGTLLHLVVPPQGRMPDIGTDGLRIVLEQ